MFLVCTLVVTIVRFHVCSNKLRLYIFIQNILYPLVNLKLLNLIHMQVIFGLDKSKNTTERATTLTPSFQLSH